MATSITGNPWEFDATTEGEGVDNGGQFDHPIYVKSILFTTAGSSGACEVLDKSGGRAVTGSVVLGTNDEFSVLVEAFVDGVYVNALPASGKVFVYHGVRG